MPPEDPASLSAEEERYVLATIEAYYGADAVVRYWGPDPKHLMLHVESDKQDSLARHECLGLLMCEIVRDRITLEATTRGQRIWGSAKVAYRQGVVLPTSVSADR
ncbi:MAG: hypothetical protein Q8R45_06170 [Brevundimonas sp.]|nr:hypothetical protein [Brevundimonas sp.]